MKGRKINTIPYEYTGTYTTEGISVDIFAEDAKSIKDAFEKCSFSLDIKKPSAKYSVYFRIHPQIEITPKEHNTKLFVSAPLEIIEIELIYIMYCFTEVGRQENNIVTLHAAGISDSRNSVLILGNKGSGKTSVTLKLALDHKMHLYGNDIIRVGIEKGTPHIVSGDKQLKMRALNVKKYFSDMENESLDDQDLNDYEKKVFIDPERAGIRIEDKQLPIKKMFLVFHNADESAQFEAKAVPKLNFRLNLMENASRYIRTIGTPILNKDLNYVGYFPSLDTPSLYSNRTEILNALIDKSGVESLTGGNLDDIASYIASELESP